MNIEVVDRKSLDVSSKVALSIADGDIHPRPKSPDEMTRYLPKRWQEHAATYGFLPRHGFAKGPAYPKVMPDASRRDASPPMGGRPGSDVGFLGTHLLDPYNIELGILNLINPAPGASQNLDYAAALSTAMNQWLVDEWLDKDKRLKGSIVIPYEHVEASVKEIERWAGDKRFVQVLLMSRTAEPLGQRKYWPIFEAACRAGLPIGVHAFGYGGFPVTGGGWPSYYTEEMTGHAASCQSLVNSMVIEGVFERFPELKLILTESGFAWLPSLAWRLDKIRNRLHTETPHLKKLPSEYIKQHIWFTTQPMDEPERRKQLGDIMEWIGWDRLIFATDYPHWDWDDPHWALPIRPTDENRKLMFRENARAVWGC
jgi:uncharacterized protein